MDSASSLARIMSRNVVVAMITEPLPEKEGCTTRTVDSSLNAKLEFFIVGGANIMWAFYDLSYIILDEGELPSSYFLYAYEAQKASVRNRNGGKITFGQTLLFAPLVAAHALSANRGNPLEDVYLLKNFLDHVLSWQSASNIEDLERFCLEAIEQSRVSNRRNGIKRIAYPCPRFAGHYMDMREAATEPAFAQLMITQEIVSGYQDSFALFDQWVAGGETSILEFVEHAFPELKQRFGRFDVAADIIAVAMYLIICSSGDDIVFC